MSKALAFLVRDFLIAISYRTAFAIKLGTIAIVVPMLYFVGQGVTLNDAAITKRYGSYFAFVLVGLGLFEYLSISLRTFDKSIRESQLMGTLEIVLLSPTSITQLLLYSSLWIYLFQTIRFALYLLLGTLFGLELGQGNALSATVVLAIAVPGFAAFGIAGAALVVVIKHAEAVTVAISAASLVLGGVVYPVESLPGWLQSLAQLLPMTHALEGMRLALSQGYSVAELLPQLSVLSLFAVVLLPASLGLFWLAVRWNKVNGTLAHY